ncbi:MAG: aspartate kinase [Planctomycetota bacterium]
MRVMKFGGSSLGSAEAIRRALRLISARRLECPLVVASAFDGVTDSLIQLADAALRGDSDRIAAISAQMRQRHLVTLRHLEPDAPARHATEQALDQWFEHLSELLEETTRSGRITARSLDAILPIGEFLSTLVLGAALRGAGVNVHLLDARECLITDSRHGEARPLLVRVREQLREQVEPWRQRGALILTQGFVGCDENGNTTTLGRGGSDLSATTLAAAIGADLVEIWTDVGGVYDRDPRLHSEAQRHAHLTYDQAAGLAQLGAKILQRGCVAPAASANIPIVVRNTFAPEAGETWIGDVEKRHPGEQQAIAM